MHNRVLFYLVQEHTPKEETQAFLIQEIFVIYLEQGISRTKQNHIV